ncbi:MAG: DUF4271 domain-containing protein [Saprospiraceae bacterium]|nr:DUF4271 domain-containing protein [Saprospiraceae bacterium]
MTFSYNFRCFLILALVMPFINILETPSILAQNVREFSQEKNQEDSTLLIKKIFPKKTNPTIPILTKSHINSTYKSIPKFYSLSKNSKEFNLYQNKLSYKYYTNNIFDIGESDNPFALPNKRNTKKVKPQKKNTKSVNEVFKDLFTINDSSKSKTPQWLIFVLLGILSYMTILIAIYRKDIRSFFHAFLSTNAARILYRTQESYMKMESLASYILFNISMGTFCFLIPQIISSEVQFNTFGALLLSICAVSIVYIIKHLQLKFLAILLPYSQEINMYNFIISNTNRLLGFILVPILFLLVFTSISTQSTLLYVSFFLLITIYMYRSILGLFVAGNVILFHKFHFFIYLCAVEVAPILIILKLLSIY